VEEVCAYRCTVAAAIYAPAVVLGARVKRIRVIVRPANSVGEDA
jgi:hypothetical protein